MTQAQRSELSSLADELELSPLARTRIWQFHEGNVSAIKRQLERMKARKNAATKAATEANK